MSIQVVFEKGRAKIMGDGLEQGSFNEHELIRQNKTNYGRFIWLIYFTQCLSLISESIS